MFNRKILFGSVCALAMSVAGPALADGMGGMGGMTNFSGTLSGDYSNSHFTGGGTADLYGGNAEAMFGLGSTGANLQVDGGYHYANFQGDGHADVWNANGSLFALVNNGGRIGATGGYSSADSGGFTAHVTNYGIFGEWWASDDITAAGKVGGFDGNLIGSGYYGGGQIKFYPISDAALMGSIDHAHLNSGGGFQETDYTVSGEYLLDENTPVSAVGGWTYSNIAGLHVQTFFISLKLYCNGSGAETLVDRQRSSGTLGYDVGPGALLVKYF